MMKLAMKMEDGRWCEFDGNLLCSPGKSRWAAGGGCCVQPTSKRLLPTTNNQPQQPQQQEITNNLEQPSTDKNIQNKWPVNSMTNQPTNRQKSERQIRLAFKPGRRGQLPGSRTPREDGPWKIQSNLSIFPRGSFFSFRLLYHWRLYFQKKNKSWFPVHFVLAAMQLCVWAFSLPCGIKLLTLVPAGLAHDHNTREES